MLLFVLGIRVLVVQIITMKLLSLLFTVGTFAASSAFAPLTTRTPGVATFRYSAARGVKSLPTAAPASARGESAHQNNNAPSTHFLRFLTRHRALRWTVPPVARSSVLVMGKPKDGSDSKKTGPKPRKVKDDVIEVPATTTRTPRRTGRRDRRPRRRSALDRTCSRSPLTSFLPQTPASSRAR